MLSNRPGLMALLCGLLWAGGCVPARTKAAAEADGYLKAESRDVEQWRQMRFGMFIHWDPVSLVGREISWTRGAQRLEPNYPGAGDIPVDVYDHLYQRFNPVGFDAAEWTRIARDAGMRYLVFTTKHHDGFAMFDSRLSDYKITRSPFRRDVVKELAAACHKAGLKLGFYYSPPDWHHPDYRTPNHWRYLAYMHGQIRELCSRYGKVDIIWFDGLGGSAADWDAAKLFRMIRMLQPHIILNDRAGLPGDHETPEQVVGGFRMDRPWESCMTIGTQWSWKPDDQVKSLKECLQTLVHVAGGDGNLLLNVGPGPDGRIAPEQAHRLKEMGSWLRSYGSSIYGTRGGPFKPGRWGASTRQKDTIYLHVLDWSAGDIRLPPLGRKILSHEVLTGGAATVKETDSGLVVSVAPEQRQDIDTIVALRLDGPAGEIAPLDVP